MTPSHTVEKMAELPDGSLGSRGLNWKTWQFGEWTLERERRKPGNHTEWSIYRDVNGYSHDKQTFDYKFEAMSALDKVLKVQS